MIFYKIVLSLCVIALSGCGCPQHYNLSCPPPPLPEAPPITEPVRLALVLGGGGAKGLAHVGVIEELTAANIPIDLVIGCSAGSIVGAIYCDDPCADRLKEKLLGLKTNVLVDFDLWNARYGLCQGRSLRKFLCKHLCARTFEELQKPFFLVTTDLYSSELVTLGGGPLIPAVEASSSIPFFFVPLYLHGRAFVDGGTIDPVPVNTAKYFDPDVVVAVDLTGLLEHTFPTNLFGVATRSAEIAMLWQSECCLEGADVVIRPDLCGVGTFAADQNEQIYQAGRIAARQMIPKILACLADTGHPVEPVCEECSAE